ncbi:MULTISPECIES: hypothetical protein [unclassified Curtobacterium]|uniref:hypothetical protein n=1 Tax=unclassified Curtobacterium TaxID=257496 RepID=UPI000DA871C9|nr:MULTISPECIES: hypothetical protein [unclassified Curtobacterium]PZE24980.1 hypothetical protein DEI86_11545 [Curtobacterium sp. MCBD17_028]PZE73635.1 hypothetical protein DEI82_13575 [Curtobacterium sp. MCBD17_019]PZF56831.1 hypothetical protein DEI92_13655 [Curtobacterium sp. MCBD17_034]PZF60650.1 hypothetical protein DEI81_12655 [Curtobacterium sp. MCBD17_013]PZM33787.1 hypothetical protein DEI90_11040 [Curtobacterium sp. MCBD17_031]
MIDWGGFLLVVLVALISACFVTSVYGLGLRLWVTGRDGRARSARAAAVLCFAVCAATVLYGVYLIVPQFHQ